MCFFVWVFSYLGFVSLLADLLSSFLLIFCSFMFYAKRQILSDVTLDAKRLRSVLLTIANS